MWACEHKFNLTWCRNLQKLVSTSRVGFQAASYHPTACLLSLEDKDLDSHSRVKERIRRLPNSQQKPEGMQGFRRSSQSKSSKIKTSLLQKQKRGDAFEISSELKKLCLEDFPEDRKTQVRPKAELDSKAETHEVVFGVAPCLLALTQGRRKAYELLVKDNEPTRGASVAKVCEEAHQRGVQITWVSRKDLDKVSSGGVHQGVCLRASPLSFLTVDSEVEGTSGVPLWLILERIKDPMNLGAILRSAYFLGVDRVVSSLRHSCPLSPVVSKASSGVMEVMGVHGHKNLADLLKKRAARGWQVVGTVGTETEESHIPIVPCSDFYLSKPTMLLLGSEGDGLSQSLLPLCQTLLTVPPGRDLSPGIESLNVSVATGILLHSLLHQRNSSRCVTQQRTENETSGCA